MAKTKHNPKPQKRVRHGRTELVFGDTTVPSKGKEVEEREDGWYYWNKRKEWWSGPFDDKDEAATMYAMDADLAARGERD